MKAWGSLNSLVTDVQQSKPRDAVERESCDGGKPIAMVEPPSLPASQLPSFNRLLL
jgi:hypothetical protein